MAFKYGERVAETTTSTGTGDLVLAGALDTSYQAMSAVFANGDTTDVGIFGGGEFECCRVTYNSGPNSITRGTIYASSNGGSAVNFSAGTKTIIVSAPGALVDDIISGIIVSSFALSGVLSPSQITANQDNYSPTDLATSTVLRLSTDASRNITGLAGGSSGRVISIVNVGSNNLVLKKDDGATSTAANRFDFANDVTLGAKHGCILIYDSTSSRWRLISRNLDQSLVAFLSGGQALTGGFTGTSHAGGTVTGSNQTYTPAASNSNGQHITLNGSSLTGTFTFAVPSLASGDFTQVITEVVNGGSGAVGATLSASGYTKAETSAYNTTNGNKFLFNAIKSKNYSYLQVIPLQ